MGGPTAKRRLDFSHDDGPTSPAAARRPNFHREEEIEREVLEEIELLDIESAVRECSPSNSPRAYRERVGIVKALLRGKEPLGSPVKSCGTVTWRPPPDGIVLCELFGGLGTGLEAALRAGQRIKRYVYCDKDEAARLVAKDRCWQMHYRFPELLSPQAFERAFDTFPQDVREIKPGHLESLGQLDLVVAGWECQGFSCAGHKRGLEDPRSALFLNLVQILKWGKKIYPGLAYILENTCAQFVKEENIYKDYQRIKYEVGELRSILLLTGFGITTQILLLFQIVS